MAANLSLKQEPYEAGDVTQTSPASRIASNLEKNHFNLEKLSDEECLELSSQCGNFYAAFIQKLIGKNNNKSDSTKLPEALRLKLEKIQKAVEKHSQIQHTKLQIEPKDALGILTQAFPHTLSEFTSDEKPKINFQELSTGFYAISLPSKFFDRLYKNSGAQAVAVIVPNGISFVMLRESYGNAQAYLKHNLPHESHHIAWSHCKAENLIECDEPDPTIKKAPPPYQDELVATICSNAKIHGHLQFSGAQRAELSKEKKPQLDYIDEKVVLLYDLLNPNQSESLNDLITRTGHQTQEMLLPVLLAKNFDELLQNLQRFATILKKKAPPTEEYRSNGWGSVG